MDQQDHRPIHKEVTKQSLGYIMTALGLVAGLAWNEAIKALIERLFPLGTQSLILKFLYAIVMTAIVVVVSVYFIRDRQDRRTISK